MTGFERLRGTALGGSSPTHLRIGGVFGILVAGAALALVMQALLARALPKPDVGLISLLIGSLPLLSALSLLGQDSSTVRFLSRVDAAAWDTGAHVRRVLCLVLPLGLVAAIAGSWIYSLPALAAVGLVALVLSHNAITITTSVLRASHRYELAAATTRLPSILAALTLGALYLVGAVTLPAAICVLIACYAGTALWTLVLARFPSGSPGRRVPREVFHNGFFLFGISISLSIMIALDKLIIAKMMTYADLAIYATVFAIMKGFDFLFYAIAYVMMPHVNTMTSVRLTRVNRPIAALAVVVALAYLLAGRGAVHLLFAGRYDAGTYLILPFVAAGVMKLFYAIPSSIVGARLPSSSLRPFLWFSLLSIAVNVGLDIALIRLWGLMGAAVATAIAWSIRLGGSYWIVLTNREHLAKPPASE